MPRAQRQASLSIMNHNKTIYQPTKEEASTYTLQTQNGIIDNANEQSVQECEHKRNENEVSCSYNIDAEGATPCSPNHEPSQDEASNVKREKQVLTNCRPQNGIIDNANEESVQEYGYERNENEVSTR